MMVVLRAPSQNADLGMWFFSRQETYRLTSVGGARRTIYPAGEPGTHLCNYLPKLAD